MVYRPLYVDKIMRYVNMPFVKILTGVRRCGKSTILKMVEEKLHTEKGIPKESIVSYRFDSMEYDALTAKQMFEELKGRLQSGRKIYFFLDEEVEGWEKAVNSLAAD